jgi:CubicO group peptidase (beta-lactamase class C family)
VTASSFAGEPLPATRRALSHRVAAGQAEGRTPSLTGAVMRDGRQVWCGARSMLEGHEPDGNTQYRIGSLTKMFVAVLVMRLRDEGRLDLADPLGKYLDLSQAENVTIAQLLSHTAGLASETPGPWWERTPGELRPELASILGDHPGRHPAGRLFHYSNPGYALLGALAGRLRGLPWQEVLRQEILAPLGMARTTLSPEPPHARGFAVHPWADVMQLEPAGDTGLMAPAGELWSTAEDLCRFAACRRYLDRPRRLLSGRDAARDTRCRWCGGPSRPRDVRLHQAAVRSGRPAGRPPRPRRLAGLLGCSAMAPSRPFCDSAL